MPRSFTEVTRSKALVSVLKVYKVLNTVKTNNQAHVNIEDHLVATVHEKYEDLAGVVNLNNSHVRIFHSI